MISLNTITIAFFLVVTTGFSAKAATYNSDGSATNVQSIHDTQAHDGDTITLPAGTFTWATQINITKNIILSGAGQGVTTIIDNVSKAGCTNTTIPLYFSSISGNLRVTGFTIKGQAQDSQNCNNGTLVVGGTSTSVRIDHLNITQPGTGAVVIRGVRGVIDHCTFDLTNFKEGVQVFGDGYGDTNFEAATNLGSSDFFFIENCNFTSNGQGGAGITDGFGGGKFVFRYNTVTNGNLACHGTEGARLRGIRAYEFYNNSLSCTISLMARAVLLRGGTGVIWGNTFAGNDSNHTGYVNAISTDEYRVWNNYVVPWGISNGSSPWDQNSNSTGYIAIDQVGTGQCLDQIRGDSPNQRNQRTGTAAWPRSRSEPIYVWSNTWHQVPNNAGSYIANNQSVVQTGRDIIDNGTTPMPGYTPYTYPHPLTNGGLPAPTNLHIAP